ncbi:mitochondrial fission ELM1 family protein [Solilutibacter silvestris]|uniref:mitochondrial fission ELM1 family protein n=1 Tax=Solilutibacter silvestris TaxID=1645665 RepID=UPI003D334B88
MTVLAISDGRAGNVRQARALADALAGVEAPHLRIDAAAPWRWLAPRRLPGTARGFGDAFPATLRDPPAIAVGCGRQAALATRVLRDAGARAVQVLDPRIDPRHWDCVVVPEHDRLRGGNVLTMLGSLNPIDDRWLDNVRTHHPRPQAWGDGRLTAVLLGGPTSAVPMWANIVAAHAGILAGDAAVNGGHLAICTSPRTPRDWIPGLRQAIADTHASLWTGEHDGPNPYPMLLAHAERIVCTPDSVNMLSEACATTASVEWLPFPAQGRIAAFLESLQARERARPLGSTQATNRIPLRETARITAEVSLRLRELR